MLEDLDALGPPGSDGQFIVATGSGAFNYESGATAFTSIKQAASTTATGVVELATAAEINTGTSTTLVVTADTLEQQITGATTAVVTASDEFLFADVGSSNARKKDTVQGILDLAPGAATNLIINGDMRIAVRGTSFSSIASGSYCLDRWRFIEVGAVVVDVTQATDTPTVAEAGTDFKFSMKIDVTTADASLAASDQVLVQHKIEGFNTAHLGFGAANAATVTLSFWVKSTVTGTAYVAFKNSAADRGYPAAYTISSSNTWEKKTIKVVGDTSGTWIGATNGIGINLEFILAAGTDFHGTANAWGAGNLKGASGMANLINDAANNILITGVQLEVGAQSSDFEHRDIASELLRCQRYTWVHDGAKGATNSHIAFLHAINTTNAKGAIHPPAEMRATPTLTITGTIQGSVSGTLADTAPTISGSGSQTIGLNVTRTGGWSAANDVALITHDGTGTKMTFDAEL